MPKQSIDSFLETESILKELKYECIGLISNISFNYDFEKSKKSLKELRNTINQLDIYLQTDLNSRSAHNTYQEIKSLANSRLPNKVYELLYSNSTNQTS